MDFNNMELYEEEEIPRRRRRLRSPSPNRLLDFEMMETPILTITTPISPQDQTHDSTPDNSSRSDSNSDSSDNNSSDSDSENAVNLDSENALNLDSGNDESPSDRSSINDIPVNFPRNQNENLNHSQIIEAVLYALRQSKNLLLECPSDAERRLAVLCGALSFWQWTRQETTDTGELTNTAREVPNKIFYLTNSFESTKSIITLLNETGQLDHLQMTVLGESKDSRINEKEIQEITRNTGPYLDISTQLQGMDLVICSQEFILSSTLREDYSIDLNRAILIFDDAYNIEKSCYEEGSIKITSIELNEISKRLKSVVNSLSNVVTEDLNTTEMRANFCLLEVSLSLLARWMHENVNKGLTQVEIREALFLEFKRDSSRVYRHNLQTIISRCLTSIFPLPDADVLHFRKARKFLTVLEYMYRSTNNHDYYITLKPTAESTKIALKLICANTSIIFKSIADLAPSIILGSRCLAPMCTIKTELGIEFDETLQCNLIQGPTGDKRFFGFCSEGPNGIKFSLNYSDRNDSEVHEEVGEAVLHLCKVTPGGVIAFFHSPDFMDEILKTWKKFPSSGESIMSRLEEFKDVVNLYDENESLSPEDFAKLLNEYRLSNNQTGGNPAAGGLLLALHRTEVYDKIDFEGQDSRLIIHVSIPYGPWYSLNIIAKREYFKGIYGCKRKCKENMDWFTQEAFRVLNQSFAKSVQHTRDWGAVVVFDKRMANRRFEFGSLLPAWMIEGGKTSFKYCKNFEKLARRLEKIVINE